MLHLIFIIPLFYASRIILSIQKESNIYPFTHLTPNSLFSENDANTSRLISKCLEKIQQNMFPNSTIVASPSTQSPDYFYHWVRDSSITLSVLQEWIHDDTEKLDLLDRFAKLTVFHQTQAIQFGETGLGEPKFYTGGRVYDLLWGRPQNDGPALRFLTFAKYLKVNQRIGNQTDWWYVSTLPPTSPLKRDVEYIAHHWRDSCFDLWEEVKATHFYSRMVMYSSLQAGVFVAQRYKDYGAATFYQTQAEKIKWEMELFWNPSQSIISSFIDQDDSISLRICRLDIAVILACLHTLDFPVPGYQCTDDKILITAAKLFYHFKTEYPINWGHVYPLLGRYPGDLYDGTGTSVGNPWILSTFAFAELCFIVAGSIQSLEKEYFVTPRQLAFFDAVVPNIIEKTGHLDETARLKLVEALVIASHGLLDRVAVYTPNASFSEQLDRDSGEKRGARDLTWSYSSFLSAIFAKQRNGL